MAWRAYIDDSGHGQHSPVLVLGGWIAPIAKWAEFVPDWQHMLDEKPPIKYFKMNEAARQIAQFESLSEQRRDDLVRLAYSTIEKHVVYQVSCIVHPEPFYRLFNPSVMEESSINPYYLAFSAIISGVAREQRNLGLHDEIDFIFDDQVMEKDKILRAWDLLKANASADTRGLIGGVPYFRNDQEFFPIQAADLIAWWVRKLATEKRGGDEPAVVPWKEFQASNFTTTKIA